MSPPTAESSSINYQKKRRTSHGIAIWRQCTADDSQNRGLLRAVPAGLHLAFPFSPALRSSLFALRSCFPRCLGGAINRRVFTARFISFPYRQTLVWLCAQVRDRLQEKRKAKPRRKQQKHTPAANVCSILATFNGIELKLLPWCRVESVCTPTPTGPHKLFALPNFPCHRHFPSFANWNTRCTFLLWGMLPKKSKELQQPKNLLGQFFAIRSI